jgi:hypothetical protein
MVRSLPSSADIAYRPFALDPRQLASAVASGVSRVSSRYVSAPSRFGSRCTTVAQAAVSDSSAHFGTRCRTSERRRLASFPRSVRTNATDDDGGRSPPARGGRRRRSSGGTHGRRSSATRRVRCARSARGQSETSVTPLGRWSKAHAEVGASSEWAFNRVELDLEAVVTAVVTMTADIALGPEDGRQAVDGRASEIGQVETPLWHLHHELQLHWHLQDSVDGEKWFSLASGSLNASEPQQIRRISSPIGVYARVAFRAQPILAKVRFDDAHIQGRDICQGRLAACATRHRELRAQDLTFTMVTRSI